MEIKFWLPGQRYSEMKNIPYELKKFNLSVDVKERNVTVGM